MVRRRGAESFEAHVDPFGEVLRIVCANYRRIRIRAIEQGKGADLKRLERLLDEAARADPAGERDLYAAVVRDLVHRIVGDLPFGGRAARDVSGLTFPMGPGLVAGQAGGSSSAVELVCPMTGGRACTAMWVPQAQDTDVPVCEIGATEYRRLDER